MKNTSELLDRYYSIFNIAYFGAIFNNSSMPKVSVSSCLKRPQKRAFDMMFFSTSWALKYYTKSRIMIHDPYEQFYTKTDNSWMHSRW